MHAVLAAAGEESDQQGEMEPDGQTAREHFSYDAWIEATRQRHGTTLLSGEDSPAGY